MQISRHENTSNKLDKPWYKQFWPWFLIALPGSVVIASLFTITLAVQHAPVIVQKDIGRFVQPIEVKSSHP